VVGHVLESWTVHSDAESSSSLRVAWDFKRRFGWMGSVLEITILEHDWPSIASLAVKLFSSSASILRERGLKTPLYDQ
jgi:hypothetical protein